MPCIEVEEIDFFVIEFHFIKIEIEHYKNKRLNHFHLLSLPSLELSKRCCLLVHIVVASFVCCQLVFFFVFFSSFSIFDGNIHLKLNLNIKIEETTWRQYRTAYFIDILHANIGYFYVYSTVFHSVEKCAKRHCVDICDFSRFRSFSLYIHTYLMW